MKKVLQQSHDRQKGYTLVELLLATVIGSFIIAATYTTYALIARKQTLISAYSNVRETGLPTLRLLEKQLRIAGYVVRNAELDPVFGTISQPITITDSGEACCDTLQILYDKDATSRQKVTYRVAQRTSPTRNALLMDVSQWDGVQWLPTITGALVADYVDDFQSVITTTTGTGKPAQVDISLTIRSRSLLPEKRLYSKANYNPGNYHFSWNDNYFRDTVAATIYLRNVQ